MMDISMPSGAELKVFCCPDTVAHTLMNTNCLKVLKAVKDGFLISMGDRDDGVKAGE